VFFINTIFITEALMATVTSKSSVSGIIDRPEGPVFLKFTRTLTATETTSFDGAGDYLEIATLPTNFWVDKVNCTVSDHDGGGPTITMDLMLGDTVLVNDSTAAQAGGTISYSGALLDGSGLVLKLKIETGPTTPVTSFTYTCYVLGYYGTATRVTS
jgi:hypothetical protein